MIALREASSGGAMKAVKKKQEAWFTPPRKPKKVPGISEKTCWCLRITSKLQLIGGSSGFHEKKKRV